MSNLTSVIIPTYKGSDTIIDLVNEINDLFKDLNFEIIIINDDSPDDSHSKLVDLQKKNNKIITYIKLAKNFGEYNAVMAGLRHCKGDIAVIIDDDFQHQPSEALKLVRHSLSSNSDVVFTKYKDKKHSRIRNFMSLVNNLTAKFLIQKPKGLYLSSFKTIKRNIIDIITKYNGNYVYIDGLILSSTNKIESFEVEHHERVVGKSSYNTLKLFTHYLNLITNFSILPLRLFFIFGLIISSISFIFLLFIFFEKIFNPQVPLGYSSLLSAVIFFSGIQILFLGFIGEYIGKILKTVNKDHQYIIECTFKNQNLQK
jgi:glycosyltransferase involved in cell wall biosynthesis|tara:strand:+ start:137 stop:1078 length:942 start_codon:yes stop_codon:yes gene_type:complete